MRFPDIELETKSITDEFIVNVKDLIVRKSAEDHQALICYIDIMKKKEIDPIHFLNLIREVCIYYVNSAPEAALEFKIALMHDLHERGFTQ